VSANFVVAGVSFKKTDVAVRGKFAFTPDQCIQLYRSDIASGSFFILSTCNRTEVYGITGSPSALIDHLSVHAGVEVAFSPGLIYLKSGYDAVAHLFRVASGLDSQIPGDYEIVSQLKTAFRLARENNRANGYLEKVLNFALQASKEVKRSTAFSDGTLSIPYMIAKSIAEHMAIGSVTVIGAGATARLVVNAIKRFVPELQVNVVNRTLEKVQSVIDEHHAVAAYPETELSNALKESGALIITTNSAEPLIHDHHLVHTRVKTVFDLSVPRNAADSVYAMPGITTVDVDQLSTQVNCEIRKRESEASAAEMIVLKTLNDFRTWSNRREFFSIVNQVNPRVQLTRKQLHDSFMNWEKSSETMDQAVMRTLRDHAA
jgi:glutamyl-tRNA reductase